MVRFIKTHFRLCEISKDGCADESFTTVADKPTQDHRYRYIRIDLY